MQGYQIGQLEEKIFACRADVFQHIAAVDLFLSGRQHLIEHAQAVPHGTVRAVCQQFQRAVGQRYAFILADPPHAVHQQLLRYTFEVKPQAPGKNGRREFLRFSGRQNEHHIFRRFFQCLEQCVKRPGRQHMHFVDDIDFFPADCRRILDTLPQLADILDAVVGSRVDLDHVHKGPLADRAAVCALAARPSLWVFVQTVDALGKDARGRRLTRPACAAEQIRVADLAACDLMFEDSDDVFLPEDLVEHLRTFGTI